MLVRLSEKTERHGGDRAVAPRVIEAAKQIDTVLSQTNNDIHSNRLTRISHNGYFRFQISEVASQREQLDRR